MTYEIKSGTHSNSIEIYFDGKPSQAIRDALKALRFRWHNLKKCWYGFATESTARDAILTACDGGDQVATDGYLGGGAVYGGNSSKYLHGADLSAAIRADLKKMGIKGVTISCKTYTGGQSLTATVKYTPADLVPLAQYVEDYRIDCGARWIETEENPAGIHRDTYYTMSADEQEATRKAAAEYYYKRMTEGGHNINQYYISKYTEFTPAFLDKLQAVNKLISSYRYDGSNTMVDYFDTNFYYDICAKCAA